MPELLSQRLAGRTITAVRPLMPEERDVFGWPRRVGAGGIALELDDGSVIVPSQDPEGNGAGALFHVNGLAGLFEVLA
jgi:hypothetical protein